MIGDNQTFRIRGILHLHRMCMDWGEDNKGKISDDILNYINVLSFPRFYSLTYRYILRMLLQNLRPRDFTNSSDLEDGSHCCGEKFLICTKKNGIVTKCSEEYSKTFSTKN